MSGMPRIKNLRNFAITLFIFQHLVTIKSFPIIDESSVQETLITTASSADFKLELSTENDVNKEDKSNEEPKKSYAAEWSYNNPDGWADLASSSCGGSHQSPINIQPNSSVKKVFRKFTFHNYGNIEKMDLMNNGHTVVYSLPVGLPADRVPFITGGGLNDTYNFVQMHLHWGSDSTKGSEHQIRSISRPAELHMVHYNTKYGTYAAATEQSDGLAVLGIFLEIGSTENEAFRPLVEQLGEVLADADETTLKNLVSLKDLLPAQTASFYRYSGSLTTPRCNQIVIWTVFDNPVVISEEQLNKFRGLKNNVDDPLVNNFRPVQPLNDRTVLYRSITGCKIPR